MDANKIEEYRTTIERAQRHGGDHISMPLDDARALLARDEALEQYEAQTIVRTEDMPAEAFQWVKTDQGTFFDCLYEREPYKPGYEWEPAPDYMPDTPGPVYRAIVDIEEIGDESQAGG